MHPLKLFNCVLLSLCLTHTCAAQQKNTVKLVPGKYQDGATQYNVEIDKRGVLILTSEYWLGIGVSKFPNVYHVEWYMTAPAGGGGDRKYAGTYTVSFKMLHGHYQVYHLDATGMPVASQINVPHQLGYLPKKDE